MSRHPEWEQRLSDYIRSIARTPHEYGSHDCMFHPGKAATAVTGKDYLRGHRNKYNSQAKAVRHLRAKGFDSPEAMLDSLFDECPIGFAQRGDIVLTPANDENGWDIPGVVVGDVAMCVSTQGLVAEPRARWLKAWKVGR
jgi:hypothetical protein